MPITPSDIEHKTFSTALRGYDLDEVDDFLDEIVLALRDLNGELTAAKAKIAELEQSKGSGEVDDEASVGRVLILAQQAADRTTDDARVEAERLLAEAHAEADRALNEARAEADSFEADRAQRRAEAEAEMAELSVLVAGVRNQLALLATTVADKLDEMDSTIVSVDVDASAANAGVLGEDSGGDHDAEDVEIIVEETEDSGAQIEETTQLDLENVEVSEIATEPETEVDSGIEDAADLEEKDVATDDSVEGDQEAEDEDGEPPAIG